MGDNTQGKLTLKQTKALQKYLICENKTEAYRFAYSTENMKPATINRLAFALFEKDKIKSRLEEKKNEIAKRNDISIDRILQEEKCISYLDPAQLFELEGNQWTQIAPPELPEEVRRAIAGITVRQYNPKDEHRDSYTEYKYKFWDKGRSLERIGRHKSMYNDKLTIGIDPSIMEALKAILGVKMFEIFMSKVAEIKGQNPKKIT